jgi:hypothetical protein
MGRLLRIFGSWDPTIQRVESADEQSGARCCPQQALRDCAAPAQGVKHTTTQSPNQLQQPKTRNPIRRNVQAARRTLVVSLSAQGVHFALTATKHCRSLAWEGGCVQFSVHLLSQYFYFTSYNNHPDFVYATNVSLVPAWGL